MLLTDIAEVIPVTDQASRMCTLLNKLLLFILCTWCKPKPTVNCKNCSYVCAYHCTQPSYTVKV